MENKIGIDHIDEDSSYWEEQEESGKDFEKAETEVQENLESMLEETQESLPSENNPMESVSSIQNQICYKLSWKIQNNYPRKV